MSGLIRTADLVREGGADRSIRRSAQRGDTVRVARGRYLAASEWDILDRDRQYRTRVHAFAETTRTRQVFSHWSAAALWGYPIIGAWPNRIHVTFAPGSGQRSTAGVVRHITALGDDELVERDGVIVTSPLRTIVDLVRSAPFVTGIAALDYALATPQGEVDAALHLERGAILERAERLKGQRGIQRLRSAAAFADGRSGSPGESHSRVQLARLHFPPPELQVEVVDRDGRAWHTDFGWEGYRLLGEFDGLVKYTRDCYLQGREVADVVIEEKVREDAVRLASGCGMARWTWPVASDLARLKRLLFAAGLRPE